jgi:DNA-directed RNA polymerase subunit K/omega
VFGKFRAWLLNVYKSLSNLHVDLTPEVRGVFDRMLATNEQIDVAEAMRSYKPLFADRNQAGMTPAEWQAYQDIGAKATEDAEDELQKRSLRDMRWASNARSKALKELQATAEEKRKATRAEAAAQVNAEPIYQVQRWLRKGEMTSPEGEEIKAEKGFRLNTDTLKEMYPETSLNRPDLEKLRGMTSPEGLHPDQVAEIFGFSSGDELVRKLVDLEPAKQVIDAVTDQKMLERYGDLTDPVAMARAADAAVHNEARSKFVATELRALQRAMNAREKTPAGGSVNVLAKAAREFAAETISRKRVRDVKPAQFDAAETRAAQASEKATRKGDFPTAVMEKRNQLINGYASKVAHAAVDEVAKGVDYLKKFSGEGTRKNLDPDYTDQIDALLERFDLRTGQSGAAIDKRKALADWITKQEDLGFTPDIDPQLRNEAFRTSYKDMTIEQFRGLVDAVRNIEHLGRLKKKLLTAQDGRDFAAHVATAEQAIHDNAKKTIPEELEHNTFSARIKSGVKEYFAMHRKFASLIRQMDGFVDGGPLWETFVRPLNKAGDFEATRRAQATRELGELFKPIEKAGKLREKKFIPEIGKSLSREGRISIALNWGNETNRRRVLEGDKWTPAQVGAILDTLTKPEWDFVQGVWDHINQYWPEIAAKERRVTGNTPEKVEASPVITKHGEYRGGYYPIKYDPVRSTRAESDSMAEIVKQTMQGMYTRATTRRGHTQERAESVERPMRKDLGVIFEHVNQVIHDLAYHEYLIDANRLLRAGAIDGAIRDHYGPEVLGVMRDVLKDVAAGDIPAQNAFERGMNYLRTGSTVAGLGWSVMTSLLQPIGLTQSMVRIGPKWVGRGLAKWIGDAAHMEASTKYIFEKSPMMKLRAATFNRELNEIRNRVSKDTGGVLEPVKESFYYLIGKLQMVADVPTWLGQYEKEMDASGDEQRAIALADQAVIDAQGHGQIKDLAAIQRGGPFMKLFTNFYSFFNTTLNLTAESFNRTNFKKPGDVGRMAVDMLLLYTIPAVFGTLVHSAIRGDDKDKLAEQIIRDQINYMTGTLVGVRELGSAINGNDYSGPASLRFYATVSKLVKQVGEGKYTKATWEALNNVAGVLFHYPSGQVQRTAEGVSALVNGDTNNPGALISGPPPKPH